MRIRQAAAVYFKNLVKEQWDVVRVPLVVRRCACARVFDALLKPAPQDPASSAFKPEDRVVIKTHLVNLMCSAPEAIRRPLSDSLTCISEHDFPYQWESLLPELVTKLASSDFAVINGVLETANSVFKRCGTRHSAAVRRRHAGLTGACPGSGMCLSRTRCCGRWRSR